MGNQTWITLMTTKSLNHQTQGSLFLAHLLPSRQCMVGIAYYNRGIGMPT